MMPTFTSLSSLTDEELLMQMYTCKPLMTAIELELAARLEHALDLLNGHPPDLETLLARDSHLGGLDLRVET